MEKHASQGEIWVHGGQVHVRFRFNKRRFETIKRLPHAAYDKELKCWRLPLLQLEALTSSKLFSEGDFLYNFDRAELQTQLQGVRAEAAAAGQRIQSDPFSVRPEDLQLAAVDLVLQLSSDGRALYACPSPRTRARLLLARVPGVFYVKGAHAYVFPVGALKAFLASLRREGISFAVEAGAGERLKRTASLRAEIFAGSHDPEPAECAECLLAPCLECAAGEEASFALAAAADEQLRELFPWLRGAEQRSAYARQIPRAEALRLLAGLQRKQCKVWLTAAARAALCRQAAGDALLMLQTPERVWLCDKLGGGLLLRGGAEDPLCGVKWQGCSTLHPQFPEAVFLRPPDEQLPVFFDELAAQGRRYPASSAFLRLHDDIRQRTIERGRCEEFQRLQDSPLKLHDAELAARLFPHQRVAVAWLLETSRGFLGDDMGLGKTLSVLAAFQELKRRDHADFLLVACPNTLVRTWLREAHQWVPGLNFTALPDEPEGKRIALKRMAAWDRWSGLVVNYETLRLDYVYPELAVLCGARRVMLCLDESQRVKNPTSKTCKALRRIAPACERRVLLSGTPTPRDISDIWAQMLLLDDGRRLGTNYYAWLATVAEIGNQWSEYAVKRFIPERTAETVARVREVLLRRRKEDVIDLPEKLFSVRDVELGGDQRKRYDELRKELLLRLSSLDGNTFYRQIDSILEQYLRAVQIASNPRIIDDQWQGEPAKFVELDDIVQEVVCSQGGKLVVWTNFRRNVEELAKRYAPLGIAPFYGDVTPQQREAVIQDFQSPSSSLKMLAAIPAAGGVGITLTAAQTAVYLDKTWNAEHWQQSVDRLHRIGQRGTVHIISLHACGVDELIARNLRRKMRDQAKLLGDGGVDAGGGLPTREELLQAVQSVREVEEN